MVTALEYNIGGHSSISGKQNIHKLINFDILNSLLKANDGRDRRPNFAIFVIWSISYVLAEFLERERSISLSNFYGQLVDYYSHIFALSAHSISSPSRK